MPTFTGVVTETLRSYGAVTLRMVKVPSGAEAWSDPPRLMTAPATGRPSVPITLPVTVIGTGGVIWIVAPALSPAPALAGSGAVGAAAPARGGVEAVV